MGEGAMWLGEYPFENWNYDLEESVMGNVFEIAKSATLTFGEPRDIQVAGGGEQVYSDTPYTFAIVDHNSVSSTYEGLATFTFGQDNSGNWSISLWEDKKTAGTTWGYLRGINAPKE